jgi:hypothetical protein
MCVLIKNCGKCSCVTNTVLLLGNIVGCYGFVTLCSFSHSFITVTQKDEIRKRVTSFQNFVVPLRRKGKQ